MSVAPAEAVAPQVAAAAARDAATQQQQQQRNVVIRKAQWEDLGAASRLLVTEFYGKSCWFPAQCLSELNRLQTNFHFDPHKHLMLVATDPLEKAIIGFVDIDAREAPLAKRSEFPPRPYLSDLAVQRNRRRQGIGSSLVSECERVCQAWGCSHIYLKVQAQNPAGLGLYERLGYHQARPVDDKDQMLLSKTLSVSQLFQQPLQEAGSTAPSAAVPATAAAAA